MARLTIVGVACLLAATACYAADDRIGFRDDCSNAEGWVKGTWPGLTEMASITTDGQQATFTTLNGTFMTGASAAWAPDWPDWDKNADAGLAMISRKYPGTVDLDRYHYLVARMTFAGTYMALAVNGWDTKVCYTTGLHAVDLRDLNKPNLHGTQPIELRLTFLNTQGKVTLDEVRLVDRLTPEEQAGFIPAGLDLRLQRLEPQPYHGLEALNARSGAPVRFDLPMEQAAFRDTSTGAPVWRLTRSVRTEMADSFSPDGSALPIYNRSSRGMVFWDFDSGGLKELPDLRGGTVFSLADPSVVYLLETKDGAEKAHYVVRAANFRTGEIKMVAEWDSTDPGSNDFRRSPYSDLLVLELKEGRALFLIDPRVPDPAARVRRVPLPMRMKGVTLSHQDQRLNWQRCYYFQPWQMDLATGQIQLGGYPTYGGHEIFGGDTVVGRYVSLLLSHRLGMLPLDEAHADEVMIWSNWTTDVPSDYGQLGPDGRWLCTNGTDREVAGKRLLIDGNESGTVLQVVHDFTSRNSWDSNTYTRISPDATKLAYMCDMLGDTDVYLAVARRPQAPRNVTLAREGDGVHLRWEPPAAAREVAGYNVYRGAGSGRDYRRINRERIQGTEFTDPAPPAGACYALTAEEHSGLEGVYSAEVHLARPASARIYAEVEEAALTPPLRQQFDGACSNFRCARVWKETPEEVSGRADVPVSVPVKGDYAVWARVKGAGGLECRAGAAAARGPLTATEWAWRKLPQSLALAAGQQAVVLASDSDGLQLDLLLLTSVPGDRPERLDDRDPVPAPVAGLKVTENTAEQVRLAWDPSRDPDLDYYSVYVGESADLAPGNATLLCSGRATEALDWGYRPDSTLFYKVVAVNKRGLTSTPVAVGARTPAFETATIELPAADATLASGLALGEAKGLPCAWLPEPQSKDAPQPRATWRFTAPRAGKYYLWARYTTYDAKSVGLLWFSCSGDKRLDGTNWRLRLPCTLTRHLAGVKPGEETWFSDKLLHGFWAGPTDFVILPAGEQTLSVAFSPTQAPNGPRLATVWLSSDPSYRPPGFDPRVDFVK